MANAVVNGDSTVTLELSAEEARNLQKFLYVHSVISYVDTYPIFVALDNAAKDADFLFISSTQAEELFRCTRVTPSGLFEIIRP